LAAGPQTRQRAESAMKLGILSDTHGYFDPRLPHLLAGVDRILHAGDICSPRIVADLEQLAPVTAVAGNNDYDPILRETEIFQTAGIKIHIRHIVPAGPPNPDLRAELRRIRPDLVVFGHTHRFFDATFDGVRFLNPGFSGHPRLGNDRGVVLLDIATRPWNLARALF